MAPYSSPAPSFRSIQYSAPIRSLVLSWASAQLLPAFSSPSRRMHGHGTRPVGLRVLRPERAMVLLLADTGKMSTRKLRAGTDKTARHPQAHRSPPKKVLLRRPGRRVDVRCRRNRSRAEAGCGGGARGRWAGGGSGGGGAREGGARPEPVARTAWARPLDEPTRTTSC